jgi:hypothetical protein
LGLTLAEKIWRRHVVDTTDGGPDLLYIDLHLMHEMTSPRPSTGFAPRALVVHQGVTWTGGQGARRGGGRAPGGAPARVDGERETGATMARGGGRTLVAARREAVCRG